MTKTKISKHRVVAWLGDETTDAAALLRILTDILTGETPFEQVKKEVLSYEFDDNEERELADGTCEECGDPKIVFTDETEEECKCLECDHVFESSLR